jgi:hypothetical protein
MMLRDPELRTSSVPLQTFPQGLKPGELVGPTSGTTEVVPFQSSSELGGKG